MKRNVTISISAPERTWAQHEAEIVAMVRKCMAQRVVMYERASVMDVLAEQLVIEDVKVRGVRGSILAREDPQGNIHTDSYAAGDYRITRMDNGCWQVFWRGNAVPRHFTLLRDARAWCRENPTANSLLRNEDAKP